MQVYVVKLILKLQADQYDDNDESTGTSLFAIMKQNKPEWWILLIGSIASIGTGATMPVFAIIFGDIISVCI